MSKSVNQWRGLRVILWCFFGFPPQTSGLALSEQLLIGERCMDRLSSIVAFLCVDKIEGNALQPRETWEEHKEEAEAKLW